MIDWFRRRFRFTLVPTLFTVPSLIVLIGLGTWQVERLQWKTGLIAERVAALSAAPVAAPATADEAAGLDFHRVTVIGTFDHGRELYIWAEDERGVAGFQVVTPLTLEDGGILLVNRGFVPDARKNPATRAAGQAAGTVEIDGILRIARKPIGWLVPSNQPAEHFWVYVDPPAMATAMGLDPARLRPYFVEAGPKPNPGGLPVGGQTRIQLPNDHLQYAITWYGFAVTLLVIYLVYHYRKPE